MKSRVNRARSRLADMLSIASAMEFGRDGEWQAIDSTLADQRYVSGDGE
jgi:RNA polymerase sigma-70 factor (ECF subfamily)